MRARPAKAGGIGSNRTFKPQRSAFSLASVEGFVGVSRLKEPQTRNLLNEFQLHSA